MDYKIIECEEKVIVGVSALTGNSDPEMGSIIGGLWGRLYEGGVIGSIKNKANQYAIGLYSDYSQDKYQVTVGVAVTKNDNPELACRIIPAGKYAKFSVHGNQVTAVSEAWSKIWAMDLPRSFTGDYEEYLNCDCDNADVDIYIALQ